MDKIGIKEIIIKIWFFISRINYKREKNFFIGIFFSLIVISAIFSFVLISQRKEIARKENILKSYYETEDSALANKKNIISGSSEDNIPGNSSNSGPNNDNSKTINNEETSITSGLENSAGNDPSSKKEIYVIKAYICGFVVNPGVYEIENGSRVIDLLNKAGGPAKNACLESINLALVLTDCAKIYLPSYEEIKKGKSLFFSFNNYKMISSNAMDNLSIENSTNIGISMKLININQVSNPELESLPGIGSKIAEDIINYRNNNGFFKSKEDLKNIKGIGEKKYEKIKDLISI
jgi:competence protein ComEA